MNITFTNIDDLLSQISDLTTAEKVYLHNAYCQNNQYYDDEIYENDEEFFNMFFENKPFEAVRSSYFGEYKYSDDFVKFNGYGNLESFGDYSIDNQIDLQSIANDIYENTDYYNDTTQITFELEEELETV